MNININQIHLFSTLAALLFGFALACGCASQPTPDRYIIKQFHKDAPLEDMALVVTSMAIQNGTVRMKTIAEGVGMDGVYAVNHQFVLLKPGRYSFDIEATRTTQPDFMIIEGMVFYPEARTDTFGLSVHQSVEVKADHVYYLKGSVHPKYSEWQATILEIGSGDIAQSGNDHLINGYAYVRDKYNHPSILRMGEK